MRSYALLPSQQVMQPSITPHSTRDDVHFHARKFHGCSICLQYISLMYLETFSPSLVMDSQLGFAKANPCMIEVALPIDTSSIKSSTTFNSLSSSPEAYFQQQQLEHAPQHLLLHADRELLPLYAAPSAPSASGIVRAASLRNLF